ncbi:MAG: TIGR03620 family F420-dependent LLM class oxidoreductase [Sphingomonadaceae bacterium]|nr:TIGR03620 family F420-dependent LLM class oxidoreductase [Sphingomonadaceae bacterium]
MGVPELGKVGIWSMELRFGDKAQVARGASLLEELGFGALWIPGVADDRVLKDAADLLAATDRIAIATGILNLWKYEPREVADWFAGLSDAHKARMMVGIGISHSALIGDAYAKPMAKTRAFVEGLEAAGMAMDNTCLAALGPKMLALSGEKTAGAHPYLANPEHTARAREILGPGKFLAPEQGVAFADSVEEARKIANAGVAMYKTLPNYRNNWKRLGFTDEDIDSGSDRFIDAIFACGSVSTMAERVRQHLDAGADHVCLQVISPEGGATPDILNKRYRELAEALF